MTGRPIPFSAPMVAALRAGTKTQTRRVLKGAWQSALEGHDEVLTWFAPPDVPWLGLPNQWAASGIYARKHGSRGYNRHLGLTPCRPSDRLWVRESYFQRGHWAPVEGEQTKRGRQKWGFVPADEVIAFDQPAGEVRLGRHSADPGTICWHKRLGRFMPRTASRMTLLVTDVRVQRLQDISEEDAIAEGVTRLSSGRYHCGFDEEGEITCKSPVTAYANLWNSINGEDAWMNNPWVVAYSFIIERRNIDEVLS